MTEALKHIPISERDFLTCGDCEYFIPEENIDNPRYREKLGRCSKHHTFERNILEKNCPDNTALFHCVDCAYFRYPDSSEWENWPGDESESYCLRKDSYRYPDDRACYFFRKVQN